MKNFTLLFATLLTLSMAYAQEIKPPVLKSQMAPVIPTPSFKHNKLPSTIDPNHSATPIKVASSRADSGIAMRLVAVGSYVGNGTTTFDLIDSATYSYSHDRGGDLTHTILFSNSEAWNYYNKSTGKYSQMLRYSQTYDNNNNVIIYIEQTWDNTNSIWVNTTKDSSAYNANNQQTYFVNQAWNINTSAWVNQYNYSYTYNGVNKETNWVEELWNGSAWVNYFQGLTTYNGSNGETSYTLDSFNHATSLWANYLQHIYTRNTDDIETSDVYQIWNAPNSATWLNYTKDSNTIVGNNNDPVSLVYENWDPGTSSWVNNSEDVYTWDSNNNTTSITAENWDGTNLVWVNDVEDLYTFTNNNMVNHVNKNWNINTSAWDNNVQDIYAYTGNNQLSQIHYIWKTSAWDTLYGYFYTYDGNNNQTSISGQSWGNTPNGIAWKNGYEILQTWNNYSQQTSYVPYLWDSASATWITSIVEYEYFYYYEQYTTGVNQLSVNSEQLAVYPNPSGNFIHADIQLKQPSDLQLRLVNILGQIVWNTNAGNATNYESTISVANLPDGIYLLEMITGNGTQSRKVVVTH